MKKTLLLLLTGIVAGFTYSGIRAQTPTWSENVACILYTNCTKCHFPGGPGPFSLLHYSTAYTSRYQIKAAVQTRYMPPWPPDENYQTYAHERLLSQQEIDVISAWVDGGAPQGDTLLAPPVPPYNATGSQMVQVDYTGNVGNYTNAATQDDYRCFYISTHLGVDKYIEEIEMIPGTRNMVHHALIYIETDTNAIINLDNNDPGMGWTNFGGTGLSSSKLLCTWVPGTDPLKYPSGMGVKLPANAYIVVQIHYPQGTDGDTDSNSVVNLKFASGPVREVSQAPLLNFIYPNQINPWPLYVPANSTRTFVSSYTIPSATSQQDYYTILDILPHMHQVGKSIEVYAIKPTSDTVKLINIPDWDFKWQGQYSFRQPVILPEGTILKAVATYDNTTNNTSAPNPNSPVVAGEASTDEMLQVYFSFLYYASGDENIAVDTVTVKPYWNNCFFMANLSNEEQEMMEASVNLYPNPTHDVLTFSYYMPSSGPFLFRIIDLSGRVIYEMKNSNLEEGNYQQNIETSHIPSGTYMASFQTNDGYYTRKFVVVK